MAKNEVPLSLVIKAVDQATAPLRAINQKINAYTQPVRKLNNSFKALSKEAGLGKLVHGFKHVGEGVKGVFEQAGELTKKFLEMEVIGGFAFYELLKGSVEAGAGLKHAADRAGFSVDAFAQLRFAAEQAGVSQEEFGSAVDQLNKRLGEAKAGKGPLLEFLQGVGPGLARQVKHTKNAEEALGLLSDAFRGLSDPTKKAALQNAAFGKGSKEMGTFLSKSAEETETAKKRFFELAGSQEELANRGEEAEKALKQTKVAFLGLRNAAATGLFPALTKIAVAIADILASNRGSLAQWAEETGAAITTWIQGGGIEDVIKGLREFKDTALSLIKSVGGFKTVLIAIGLVMAGPLISSIVALIPAVIALGTAILTTPLGWILAGLAAIAVAAVYLYNKFEVVRAVVGSVFGDLGESVKEFWAALMELWQVLSPVLLPVLKAVGMVLGTVILGAVVLVTKQIELLVKSLTLLTNAWSATAGFIGKGINLVAGGGVSGTGGTPTLGATSPGAPGSSEAKVTVDFQNMPKGTRVTQAADSETDVNLFMGYASVLSQ